eukprot:351133-Chlamydomonas_euryale.AAC.7
MAMVARDAALPAMCEAGLLPVADSAQNGGTVVDREDGVLSADSRCGRSERGRPRRKDELRAGHIAEPKRREDAAIARLLGIMFITTCCSTRWWPAARWRLCCDHTSARCGMSGAGAADCVTQLLGDEYRVMCFCAALCHLVDFDRPAGAPTTFWAHTMHAWAGQKVVTLVAPPGAPIQAQPPPGEEDSTGRSYSVTRKALHES